MKLYVYKLQKKKKEYLKTKGRKNSKHLGYAELNFPSRLDNLSSND